MVPEEKDRGLQHRLAPSLQPPAGGTYVRGYHAGPTTAALRVTHIAIHPGDHQGKDKKHRGSLLNAPELQILQGGVVERSLPSNEAAEAQVIGAILYSLGRVLPTVRTILPTAEAFYAVHLRLIYEACLCLTDRGEAIDTITVGNELRRDPEACTKLRMRGGPEVLLVELTTMVATVENVEAHAKLVLDHAVSRRRVDLGRQYTATASRGGDVAPLLEALQQTHQTPNTLRTVRMLDVQPEPVRWLWSGRVPEGKITVLDGDPGLGKSTMVFDLAARLSAGRPMPGEGYGVQGHVVIWSVEDGLADTIRPRLEAAGADLSRITAITEILSLPEDLPRLFALITATKARLFILDPLMAALSSGVKSNNDQDIRRTLAQLQDLGQRTGCAILIIRHLNKGEGPAMYRGGGSIGIIGAARSGLVVGKDPRMPETRRILARTKCNLAPPVPALCYSFLQRGDVAIVHWEGECDITADELLSRPKPPAPTKPASSLVPPPSLEDKILACLLEHPGGLIADAVARAVHTQPITVKMTLRRMADAGELCRRVGVRGSILFVHPDHYQQTEMPS